MEGDIDISVTFKEYIGACVSNNGCHKLISYTKTDIEGKLSDLTCTYENGSCIMKLRCTECELSEQSVF